MRIVWAAPALRDLAAARAFIALDNPAAALQQVEHVLMAVENLARFPDTGRQGRVAGTRELVIGSTPCLVAYRVQAERIEILRVLHGRQRWPDRIR